MHIALYLAQARYHVVRERKAAAHAENIYLVCAADHFNSFFKIVSMQPGEGELNVFDVGRESLFEQIVAGRYYSALEPVRQRAFGLDLLFYAVLHLGKA